MVDVRPFRALRPRPDAAPRVAAPPYDVMDVTEARQLAAGNVDSFLHVSRPEIDLPPHVDPHADEVHTRGRANLVDLIGRGVLVHDPQASFYVYRQGWRSTLQTGVVACAAVADYESGAIRTHEHTRPDKELDRVHHEDALGAHDEPVFLMSPPSDAVEAVVAAVVTQRPEYDFATDDGVTHTLWQVSDPDRVTALRSAFAQVDRLYVADGHHRSAAAAAVHRLARERSAGTDAGRPATSGTDAFLAVIFPSDQLRILPYNRAVADLGGHTPATLLDALAADFDVVPAPEGAPVEPEQRHWFGMYLAGTWYSLHLRAPVAGTVGDRPDPVAALDVAILQDRVLDPLLGIGDPRTDTRISFVGGIRGTAELERVVDEGRAAVAFSLCPTSVDELLTVADLGRVMPPKSTWFEPKLRSGLVVHPFRPVDGTGGINGTGTGAAGRRQRVKPGG